MHCLSKKHLENNLTIMNYLFTSEQSKIFEIKLCEVTTSVVPIDKSSFVNKHFTITFTILATRLGV